MPRRRLLHLVSPALHPIEGAVDIDLAELAKQGRLIDQAVGYDMDDAILPLELALGIKQPGSRRRLPVPLEDLAPDDQVDDALLVLTRRNDDTRCRARPLPDQDQACHLHAAVLRQ